MLGKKITNIENPGPLQVDGRWQLIKEKGLMFGVAAILLSAVIGYASGESGDFWKFLLINLFYFLGFAIFGYLFVAIHYAANVTWSAPVRRVAEGFTNFFNSGYVFIALIAILGIGAGIGMQDLYDWTKDSVHHHFGDVKGAYMSEIGFVIKMALFFIFIFLMGNKLVKFSLTQDESGDVTLSRKAQKLAIPFLLMFAYLFTIFVVDLLLAIDSKWFSTMFGVYCWAGIFVSGHALLAIMTVKMRDSGELRTATPKHILKDMGTYVMGFSAFFAYIGFSQFMLIWYANLPAETFYFMERSAHGWDAVLIIVAFFKFLIPFIFMMPWAMRSNPNAFRVIGGIVLVGQWLDVMWMVMPSFNNPVVSILLAIGLLVGFGSLFFHSILNFYGKHSVLAHKDPRLLTSVNGEHL